MPFAQPRRISVARIATEPGKPAIERLVWQDKIRIIWMDTLYDTGLGAYVFIGVFGGRKINGFFHDRTWCRIRHHLTSTDHLNQA